MMSELGEIAKALRNTRTGAYFVPAALTCFATFCFENVDTWADLARLLTMTAALGALMLGAIMSYRLAEPRGRRPGRPETRSPD